MDCVQQFLKTYWNPERPLLLGYSGGPDSKALLYSLLQAGVKNLHLAHIDHGWRPESGAEAEALRQESEKLGCPFHSIRIHPSEKGNQEDLARQARLAYFRFLFSSLPFQALLLAHQADDLAETALKRVLEGAHLSFLGGMQPISQREGMVIWRPMLSMRRSQILHFLKERGLKALIDPTNSNCAYLRSRMRLEILPFLADTFGKEISENLILLSERASELKRYLDQKIDPELHKIYKGPWGVRVEMDHLERVEKRHLIQKIGQMESIVFPRALLESILDWMEARVPNRKVQVRSRPVFIDRGALFILSDPPPFLQWESEELKTGTFESNGWKIEVKEAFEPVLPSHWKEVWSGSFSFTLPAGGVSFSFVSDPSLRKRWNERQVPSFFRDFVPVATRKGKIMKEFLSGVSKKGEREVYKIAISFSSKGSVSSE